MAFDLTVRMGGAPLYAIIFITIGWVENLPIAPDFRSLLLKHREQLDAPSRDN